MNRKYISALILIIHSALAFAIDLPRTIENKIYNEHIKTVEFYRGDWQLSNPIIVLNSEDQLTFTFDDLNNETQDYFYTIFHCDRNWKVSSLAQQEYLSSFIDFPITDFEYSVNTKVGYINYLVRIPNDDVPIVLSGNYALVVFDRDYPDQPLITWRFYVVEPKINISARIHRATHDPVNGENQEIDFVLDHSNFDIQNPLTDLKVVIAQNNRTDNIISDLKPVFIRNKQLEYDYNFENNFKGENEFRAFEIRNIMHPGEGVEAIQFYPPLYHATLLPDYPRAQKNYSLYKELNGNFNIEANNKSYPEIEADYLFVHFTLQVNKPLLGGGIYVFGKLSNWQCIQPFEMKYSFERQQYELAVLLKQGYYNYTYAYLDQMGNTIKCYNIEGSHYETENDYQLYVYYGKITDRYDRLIGYERFNSITNRGY